MPPLSLPQGFAARPARPDRDVAAVAELIAACERRVNGVADVVPEDVRSDWSRPSFDPGRDAVVVTAGEQIVAYADEHQERAAVFVHPDRTGLGLGAALLDWAEHHARDARATSVGQTLSENDTAARNLLRARGYEVRWDSWVFEMPLDGPALPLLAPAGITVRTLRRPADERAVHRVINDAFNEWPGRLSVRFEDWVAAHLDRVDAEPELTFVAEGADGIVGAATCIVFEGEGHGGGHGEGYIEQLAVRRAHRGQGIGKALLGAAFTAFRSRGLGVAGLNTDSRTGARTLYEHVGMRVVRSYARFAKDL